MQDQKQPNSASKQALLLRYLLLLIAISLTISLVRSIIKLTKADSQIQAVKNKIVALQASNKELQNQVEYVQTDAFIEKQARDKLGLAKSGEIVLILPEIKNLDITSPDEEVKVEFPKSNWQKWLEIFGF